VRVVVVVVGCGRVGAGLAAGLAAAGEVVAVVDKDPEAFERLGEQFAARPWRASAKEEGAFGRGEVSLLRLELPQHLVDRSVADVEAEGLRVVSVTRRGGALHRRPPGLRRPRGAGGRAGSATVQRARAAGGRTVVAGTPAGRRRPGRGRPAPGRAGPRGGLVEPTRSSPPTRVLALTTLQAEPDLRRLLGGRLGGSHIPAG
jgi:threonine dehydrogenase-like Zn-dependent dehydrogenase